MRFVWIILHILVFHPVSPNTYSCYGVVRKLPVCPLHHLVAVVVRVQGLVVIKGGPGSEDDLCVEKERPQRIGLLQPVTPYPAPKALRDSGGDGVGVVLIAFLSGRVERMSEDIEMRLWKKTIRYYYSYWYPPVEVLPDLRHNLPGDDLHVHSLVRPDG